MAMTDQEMLEVINAKIAGKTIEKSLFSSCLDSDWIIFDKELWDFLLWRYRVVETSALDDLIKWGKDCPNNQRIGSIWELVDIIAKFKQEKDQS